MKAYKLMKLRKNGTLGSLFINAKEAYPTNSWLQAKFYPTKGFAERFGWHCTLTPNAPHLKMRVGSEERVWVECDVDGVNYYDRPESQGGTWLLAERMKINRVLDGFEVEQLLCLSA